MYRLTLGGLQILAVISILFGALGILSYGAGSLLLSLMVLAISCYGTNTLLVKLFKAAPSVESSSITAFILFFLFMPPTNLRDALLLAAAGAVAMLSKYVLVLRGKHLFNPAALGAVFSAIVFHNGAIWWIATLPLLPFVTILGLLIVRKIRREKLFLVGIASAVVTLLFVNLSQETIALSFSEVTAFIQLVFTSWPIVFFASVMLTEPSTTPPTQGKQLIYGTIAGILFGLPLHAGAVYMSPEIALCLANIYSYAVSAKDRLRLTLVERVQSAKDTYHLTFSSPRSFAFSPGQYLEWTLPHKNPDTRGTRRYFTIASSPSEKLLGLGVKIGEKSSSFKRKLLALKPGEHITAAQLSGDFILPKDLQKPLVFIAGGIGITPFRSMIAWMCDQQERRTCTLFYACTNPEDFAYLDLFQRAETLIGLKTFCVAKNAPPGWNGATGYITAELLQKEVPHFAQCHFYLSGPGAMVDAYRAMLRSAGVSQKNITTDYFPGL